MQGGALKGCAGAEETINAITTRCDRRRRQPGQRQGHVGAAPQIAGKQCIPQAEPEACNELKAAQDGKGGPAPPLPRQMPQEGGRLLLLLLRPLACARENPDRNYFSAAPHLVPN